MDWITFTKQQVDDDALPSVCMVCGETATERVDKTFSHTPDWVGFLYLFGIVPGLIAEQFYTKKMRVACPLCSDHHDHWRKLIITASLGWLASLPLAGIGFLVGMMVSPNSGLAPFIGLGVGAVVGLIPWLWIVIRLAFTRVKATYISTDEITLQRVADGFVKACGYLPA
jgi:hypothetical protein